MSFLIISILFLAQGFFQYWRTRESIWIVHIGLGVVMTTLGVIGLMWHPTPPGPWDPLRLLGLVGH